MKHILIPVDFSVFSSTACKTGAFIAKQNGATIHLLFIAQAPEDWAEMSVLQQQKYPEIEGNIVDGEIKLDRLAQHVMFRDVNVEIHIVGGVAYKKINEFATRHKMDLIIMGAHGSNESNSLFIGSTAQKVIRVAPCPVLSVKKDFKPVSMKKILFASDFESESMGESFRTVKNFSQSIGGKIDIAYINTPSQFLDTASIEKKMDEFSKVCSAPKINRFIYNDTTKEEGVINLGKRIKANVLALATHNRKGKRNYLLGVTETILFHSDLPVLSQVMK